MVDATKKEPFLKIIQKESGLSSSEIYNRLGWSRARWHNRVKLNTFDVQLLPKLIAVTGIGPIRMIRIIEEAYT